MDKHTIKWGRSGLGRLLSLREKVGLLKEIDKKAKNTNVFRIDVVPAAVDFLRSHLDDANIMEIKNAACNDGLVRLIIGADKETVRAEYFKSQGD